MNQVILKLLIEVLFILILFSEKSYSQTAVLPYDSNYIDRQPSKYGVRIYSSMKQNTFYFVNQKWSDRIEFQPAQKIAAGIGFSYKSFALDLGFAVYRHSLSPDQQTKGFNFIGTLYRGRNNIDITFEINNGFSATVKDSSGATKNITRNDVDALNFGVNYNYLFNYKKLSMNAAYSGTQIQKKSAGSPLLGVFVGDMNVVSGDSLISHDVASEINAAPRGDQANVFSFGITGGYAYTLVLPHRFYLSAYATPGISFSLSQSPRDSSDFYKNTIHLGGKLIAHASAGYAGKKFYVLLPVGIDVNIVGLGNKDFLVYTPTKLKLVFGYRI